MNQNAYLAVSEDVLAALPTRATRDTMSGNHTIFSTPKITLWPWAASHKV